MKIRVNKRKWYTALGLFNGVLVLLAAVCAGVMVWLAGLSDWVDAADRWRGSSDMRFTQAACYLPVDSPKTEEEVLSFRRTLEQSLTEASLEAPDGGSLYTDAYSASAPVTVTGDHGSAQVRAIGVGGNFFLFHPLVLRSGSYISGDDLMQDRVVLDEELAWQLFGGPDVAGLTVQIGGRPYSVAGVISRESDFATGEACLDGAGMFLSYSALYGLTEQDITCYEIVLPNMVSGFGLGLVRDGFAVGTGDVVEVTGRYGLGRLLEVAGDFGLRSMRNNGVIYPYWENAVRLTEDYLALLLVLALVFSACPAVTILVLAVRLTVRTWRKVTEAVPAWIDGKVQQRRKAAYEARRRVH